MYLADRDAVWPKVLFGIWLLYYAAAWIISPIVNADHIHPTTLAFAALSAIAALSIVNATEDSAHNRKIAESTVSIEG
jgi:hypothetical protein